VTAVSGVDTAALPLRGLRLWGRRPALNVQKVLWCLDELGLAYEQIDAGQHHGRLKEAGFLRMNPNGRIPVLEAEGFALWESGAIIRFLCRHAGRGELAPTSATAWAHADQWMDWVAGTLYYPTFRNYYLYQTRTKEADKDAGRVEAMRQEVRAIMAIAEQRLQGSAHLAGEDFSMADLVFGVVADKWVRIERDRLASPGIERYHRSLMLRPAFVNNVFGQALAAV
jgi:glutathione S-transferase